MYAPDEAPSSTFDATLGDAPSVPPGSLEAPPTVLLDDRPTSYTESTSSESLSPRSSTLSCSDGLARGKLMVARRASDRSTASETEYQSETGFLRPGPDDSGAEVLYGSTPEVSRLAPPRAYLSVRT